MSNPAVRLITEWSTSDPTLAKSLKEINAIPEYSALRLEMEAALHQWQANWCLQHAAVLRHDHAMNESRKARAAATRAKRAIPMLPDSEAVA